jgi:hypothetical protein
MAFVAIALIIAIVGELFSRHYKGLIMERLPALSAKATDSLYDISIQNIRINIFTRAVTVYGLRMAVNLEVLQRRRAEGRPPHVILDVTVPEAQIVGVKWNELSAEKSLLCRKVDFYDPEIRVQIMPEWQDQDTLRKLRAPAIKRVFAGRIKIHNPHFDLRYSYGEDAFSLETDGGLMVAEDWDFHPHEPFDSTRFFAAREAQISLSNIRFTYPGALYRFAMEQVDFNTKSGDAGITGARIAPLLNYDTMYARIGYRKGIYDFRIASIRLLGLDWKELLTHHRFNAQLLDVSDGDLSVYLSKRPPVRANPARKRYFPVQLLKQLPMPLRIEAAQISNFSVRYSEKHQLTGAVGTVEFNYLSANTTAISNRPEDSLSDPFCRAFVSGKIMHRSDMTAVVDFDLKKDNGAFDMRGRISNLDASQLRDAASAFAMADISNLRISDATMRIGGNADSTYGKFKIEYNDLKLKLSRWNSIDSDIHGRYLLSFLANKLILYKDNPMPGMPVRIVETSVRGDGNRSFFPVIWANIFQACMKTVMRDEGALDIVKRRAANKGKEKRRFFKGLFPKRER